MNATTSWRKFESLFYREFSGQGELIEDLYEKLIILKKYLNIFLL